MPDLLQSLLKQDLGHLRIIARQWGVELESNETEPAREELIAALLDFELASEILETLPANTRAALDALIAKNGRIPWAEFTRQFGEIREMGAGRRDRERPHLRPASTAEALFYRGFLARAFFDTAGGPQEFAYIPDDLFELVLSHSDQAADPSGEHTAEAQPDPVRSAASVSGQVVPAVLGRLASPGEKGREIPADDHILDDATTLLAALRMGHSPAAEEELSLSGVPAPTLPGPVLADLLAAAKLIDTNIPKTDAVKRFLEAPRPDALRLLTDAWQVSEEFNELRQLPQLVFEGEWKNRPEETREFLLNVLDGIPQGKWWSISALIRDIKLKYADFQRPAGDYDSWFIKRASDGQYLRGFACWDEIDGALIRYFITGILHWLGQVDLGFGEGAPRATSFRLSAFLQKTEESEKISIASNGKITVPRFTPRAVRYQLARFCEWDARKPGEYRYHVTPHSLNKAREQGLKIEHLLALLVKHSDAGVPPIFVKALKRWEANGTEARVEAPVVLRVSRPEVLDEMRRSKAAKYLGEMLGPTAVVVKSGAVQKVIEALSELGLLADTTQAVVPREGHQRG